jgi:hypothetical protein
MREQVEGQWCESRIETAQEMRPGVPTVFLQHTRVSSGGLTREQENPEVHGGVSIANQSGSTVSSQGSTTSSSSYPR